MNRQLIKDFAKAIRREIIESAYATGRIGVHLGPALSLTDYLAVLYGGGANISPAMRYDENRDRVILSKGHAYAALYSALCLRGFFSKEEFRANYMTDGGKFPAHPIKQLDMGIECSSGSLGMGLAYAVGKALNAKKKGLTYTTFVAMGDGECDEGSTYEAFLSAVQFKLDNLVVFIDHNGFQQDGRTNALMNIPFVAYLSAIGCNVQEIDGNDIDAICDVLENREESNDKPLVIVGHTIKGKGISFMENENTWHHAVLDEGHYKLAMEELQ